MDGNQGSTCQALFGRNKDVNQEIMQLRRQLGHPSFFALGKLYPSLFSSVKFDSILCDACEYVKHTRTTLPSSNSNKSTIPFMLIHSDV